MSELLPAHPADLAAVTAFQNLPAEVLAWLTRAGELRRYADGETVVEAGAPADALLAVVAGAMRYYRPGSSEAVFRTEAGQVAGLLPYSRLQAYKGRGVAEGDTRVYWLPRTEFNNLEHTSPELMQRLVSLMNDRARNEVRSQERDDKLRALGKLSAGLSHELNNPAAAIGRSAARLLPALQAKPGLLQALLAQVPPPAAVAALCALAATPAAPLPTLPPLQAADQEDELADWLEAQGCPDGYALAADLLAANLNADLLAPVAVQLPARPRWAGWPATWPASNWPATFRRPVSASASW